MSYGEWYPMFSKKNTYTNSYAKQWQYIRRRFEKFKIISVYYETALITVLLLPVLTNTVHCLQMACGMLSAIGDFLQTGIDEIMKVNNTSLWKLNRFGTLTSYT